MEEIKTYIESGVLELYAMGELTQTERHEVEAMAVKHPAVKAELAEIEKALERYAESYSLAPPDQLRERILNKLNTSDKPATSFTNKAPAVGATVRTLPKSGVSPFYKYAFAASVALLLMSVAALFVTYTNLQNSKQQLAQLQLSNQSFANRVNYMDKQLNDSKVALSVLRNPDFNLVTLEGTPQAPQASMLVAFNAENEEVLIDLSAMKLPAYDQKHQYQLWALVDGKPVDLGVFDIDTGNTGMKRMKTIGNAQAFAVTLEPRGGSASPTMEQMVVMGSI